jgi:hypothetical protein
MVAGCGESEEGQGNTLVTIAVPADTEPETRFSCDDDSPHGSEFNDYSGEFEWYLRPTPGPCTALILLRDDTTGEGLCVHERDFVVSEVGDTEVHFTVDDCESVTMPL